MSPQADLFVFDRAPQALLEHIVPLGTAAVHADRDLLALEDRGGADTRELTALVGIEDVGLAEARQRFLQGFDAKVRLQRDRQPPAQHPAAEPVDDGDRAGEPASHRDVGDVGCPDVVGPRNCQLAEQIGADLVSRAASRCWAASRSP